MIGQIVAAFREEFGRKPRKGPVRRNPWPLCLARGERGHRVPALCEKGCGFCSFHCPGPPMCKDEEKEGRS